MNRPLSTLLFAIVGALVAAPVGYVLITMLSPNAYDLSVEAAKTAAFVFAPVGAIVGSIAGFIRAGKPSRAGK